MAWHATAVRLAQPVTAQIATGEHIAIVGPNGGGKSLFVDTLLGKYPLREGTLDYDFSPSSTRTVYDNVKYIAFRDTYGAADANYYYQQRWNAHDQEDAPTVREMLGEIKDERLKEELFDSSTSSHCWTRRSFFFPVANYVNFN